MHNANGLTTSVVSPIRAAPAAAAPTPIIMLQTRDGGGYGDKIVRKFSTTLQSVCLFLISITTI